MVRSKRHLSGEQETLQGKKKRKHDSDDGGRNILKDNSAFGELVTSNGIILKADNKPNEITKDQAVFQRDLTLAIKRHPDFPEIVDEFVEAFSKHIEDPVRLRWSLVSCITPLNCEAAASGSTQDSLARLLFGVEQLQQPMMNLLLEKLAEYSADDEMVSGDGDGVDVPHLIMNQFRWLDRVVDSKALIDKMFEVLSITSPSIQREIITCIPEVVDDLQHVEVANKLRDVFMEQTSLAVPILDAVSQLSLAGETIAELRGWVVDKLGAIELEDLPVTVRFLLHTVTNAQTADEVVQELREHLDFHSSFPPADSSTPHSRKSIAARGQGGQSDQRGTEALTLDAIRSAIRFQRCIAEAWIKSIEAVKSAGEHKVLDICVLLILHSSNHKKAVETLFRNKIRAGHFTEVLIRATFSSHAQVLREYFPSILAIAEVLLRSPEATISHSACAMYRHAFAAFDTYCRQEIVGQLVTHIGSGFSSEVDCSLTILMDLVNTDLEKMAPFAIFVKGVLDYLDQLSVLQIRTLYSMLSTLAFLSPTDSTALIQDDLYIIIRKQLTNNNNKYRRMGVIGAIMIVKCLATNIANKDQEADENTEDLSDDVYQQVVNLLELVKTSSAKTPEAMALFMDELSAVINQGIIDSKVENWIGEHVIADFQDHYVVDIEPDKKERDGDVLPMSLQLGLDEENEAIAIDLLPIVINSSKPKHIASGSAVCLAASFRLVQICEKRQQKGDLEGIDALLGCSLFLPKPHCYEKLESLSQKERHLLCDTHFIAINWLREVVNAFSSQTDPEIKAKVISRLKNIVELNRRIGKYLAGTPSYRPSLANYDIEETATSKAPVTTTAKKSAGRKKKKKDTADKDAVDSDESHNASVLDKTETEKALTQGGGGAVAEEEDEGSVDVSVYRPYMRELDMDVLKMLSVGFITRAALDTDMNTKEETTLQLQLPELLFLLQDLTAKLQHCLIAHANTRRTTAFSKGKSDKKTGFSHVDQLGADKVAKKTVELLPVLCQHLEAANTFFQALLTATDGILDGPGVDSEEARQMGACFHLLLQAIQSLLAWGGFVLTDNKALLKEALSVFAARLSTTDTTQQSVQELTRQAFNYLEQLASTVPTCDAAVTLCKLLSSLANTDGLKHKLATISEGFLKREWFAKNGEREKGARHNDLLLTLLKLYFVNSPDVLAAVESIATVGIPQLLEEEKNGCSSAYPTLTRNSYPTYYRLLLAELVSCAKNIGTSKQNEPMENREDKLLQWSIAVRIFHLLVNLTKSFDQRSNLGAVLKHGRIFLEVFLRCAMPLVDTMFRAHKDDVLALLKNLQLSTRHLHYMCGHSKILKDISLTNQIPLLKKCLEMFVYRVKVMLTMNQCAEAFWLGNLKNRDLKGAEILSQTSVASDEEDEDARDDTVLEDEEDSEVEMDRESKDGEERGSKDGDEVEEDEDEELGVGQSYSEVY